MSDEKSLYRRLGQIMRSARERADLSQDQVAEHLGIHRITYTNLENGKSGVPFHLVVKAAEFFGFSLDQLKVGESISAQSQNDELPPSVARELQRIRSELFSSDRELS